MRVWRPAFLNQMLKDGMKAFNTWSAAILKDLIDQLGLIHLVKGRLRVWQVASEDLHQNNAKGVDISLLGILVLGEYFGCHVHGCANTSHLSCDGGSRSGDAKVSHFASPKRVDEKVLGL